MTEPKPISTSEWEAAGLPFELFLAYAQASDETRREVEAEFTRRYRKGALYQHRKED